MGLVYYPHALFVGTIIIYAKEIQDIFTPSILETIF